MSDIIVIERELLRSAAFRQLNGTAKTVYFDFLMKCRVKTHKPRSGRKRERDILNNGELEYTYSEAEKRGLPRKRFMRSLDALVENGFIDISHSGNGGRKGDKNLYAISDRWLLFGTEDFISAKRSKDNRQGRGFQKGNVYGRKSSIIGVENDNPTVVENDNRK